MSKEVGTNVGEVLAAALKDEFGEGPASVCEKVRKSPAEAYVMVKYDKTRHGFALKGELVLLEPLAQSVFIPNRDGKGRYVDAIALKALGVYGKYTASSKLRRIPDEFVITDDSKLTFKSFVKRDGYKPACLLFSKIADSLSSQLMLGLEWEPFFRQAEHELSHRLKAWRGNKRGVKGRNDASVQNSGGSRTSHGG